MFFVIKNSVFMRFVAFRKRLFEGKGYKESKEVVQELMQMLPGAVTCRSHCLTQSSPLQNVLSEMGIKYELNTYIPAQDGMTIYPYKSVDEKHMILPFIFEDDLYLSQKIKKCYAYYLSDCFVAPRIFNFHPIHLYLNTDSIARYEEARPYFKNIDALKKCRNTSKYGIRDFFMDLVKEAKQGAWQFEKICEGKWEEEYENSNIRQNADAV